MAGVLANALGLVYEMNLVGRQKQQNEDIEEWATSAEQTASKQGKFGLKWRADAIEERTEVGITSALGFVVEAKFPELEVVVEFDQSVRGEGRDHGDDAKNDAGFLWLQAMMRTVVPPEAS